MERGRWNVLLQFLLVLGTNRLFWREESHRFISRWHLLLGSQCSNYTWAFATAALQQACRLGLYLPVCKKSPWCFASVGKWGYFLICWLEQSFFQLPWALYMHDRSRGTNQGDFLQAKRYLCFWFCSFFVLFGDFDVNPEWTNHLFGWAFL